VGVYSCAFSLDPYSMEAPVSLTCEQEECVNRALEGHNFAIFGEGGTESLM